MDEAQLMARVKAFLDRWKADPGLRTRVEQQPDTVEVLPGVASAQFRSLWAGSDQAAQEWPARFRDFMQRHQSSVDPAGLMPQHPRMRAWRERQMARLQLQIGWQRAQRVRHLPAAFELAKGCSVGCWFCGVSAAKLSELWPYTEANASSWKELLLAFKDFVGPALGWGFCYWATDPLDNPDYEKFCEDFYQITGRFPGLTTALALKDPQRTRRLLRSVQASQGNGVHFSVLSRKQFDRLCEEFTPEELLFVELVHQYPGSIYHLAHSGRARQRAPQSWTDPGPNTIACVSGWLVNLVEGSLRLITPCAANEDWPEGTMTLARHTFHSPDQLPELLQAVAQSCMPLSVEELPRVTLSKGLRLEPSSQGFTLLGDGLHLDFSLASQPEVLRKMGELVVEGRHPAEQIAMLLRFSFGTSEAVTLANLENLFRHGALEETSFVTTD